MKIAVSSCGIFLESPIDPRFGRCDFFFIVDAYDMSFEVFANENVGLTQGAGVQSANLVVSKGAKVVISGNVGPNAIRALRAAGVEVVICRTGSIKEAIENFQKRKLDSINNATVRDHYGMVGKAGRELMKRAKAENKGESEKE